MHSGNDHVKDSDCTVDPNTDCCIECGVLHSDPECFGCGGRAFHTLQCMEDAVADFGAEVAEGIMTGTEAIEAVYGSVAERDRLVAALGKYHE